MKVKRRYCTCHYLNFPSSAEVVNNAKNGAIFDQNKNIIHKLPPFVPSFPTSADYVKKFKFSLLHFEYPEF